MPNPLKPDISTIPDNSIQSRKKCREKKENTACHHLDALIHFS